VAKEHGTFVGTSWSLLGFSKKKKRKKLRRLFILTKHKLQKRHLLPGSLRPTKGYRGKSIKEKEKVPPPLISVEAPEESLF